MQAESAGTALAQAVAVLCWGEIGIATVEHPLVGTLTGTGGTNEAVKARTSSGTSSGANRRVDMQTS